MKRAFSCLLVILFFAGILALNANAQDDLSRRKKIEEELARLEKKSFDSGPFGALEFLHWNHSWNNYKYSDQESIRKTVELMKEAGVGWLRMDFLWQDIEPVKGKLDFSKYDYIVDLVLNSGIEILGLLNYSTDWASAAWNSSPASNKPFVNYVSKVIGRYKDKIKYWEVWNEPDDPQYWTPQDGMERYASLLKDVYLTAKRLDPDCKVLNGGLAKNITVSLRNLYKNGAGDYFDILAIHPFVNLLNQVDVVRVKGLYNGCNKIMRENGDDKKIWFTEIGCPGVSSPSSANSWWLGMSPTEDEQAEWVKRVYTEILPELADCEMIFWAFFKDCNNYWHNGIDYFGLVRNDFSRKGAFEAYQEAVRLWAESPVTLKNPRRN